MRRQQKKANFMQHLWHGRPRGAPDFSPNNANNENYEKNMLDIPLMNLRKCPPMNQPTIKKLSLAIVATMACGTLMAQGLVKAPGRQTGPAQNSDSVQVNGFGGNLETNACTACNFDELTGGYYVWGTNNCIAPGTTQWIGAPFISKRSGTTRQISAGIELDAACSTSTNQVTLGIYADDCTTGVGTLIASGRATVSAGPCVLAVARVRAALVAGTRYWVAATTNSTQAGLDSIWYNSNQTQISGNVASGGWFLFGGNVPSFSVD
jgi:hypothetical protein